MQVPSTIDRALALRPADRGPALLAALEDQWFDRKSARIKPRDLADALIGVANADGGTVVVGLSNGRVEGTNALRRARNELVQAAVDFCVPPVRATHRLLGCVTADGARDQLLVLEVAPSEGVVHANTKDHVFLRIGDENRRLSFVQRQELTFDRGSPSYEARPLLETSPADLDPDALDAYARLVGAKDVERLMNARGLRNGDALTVAGCLLFADAPQRWLPEAFVRVLRYRGSDRGSGARQQVVSDRRFEGPIPRLIVQAREEIDQIQPRRRALRTSGRFEDLGLVPEDAWLEGLVNAVIHRSYSLHGDHVRVEVFDDRIEITSPGRFPGIVDPADPLDAPRFARNPRIARVCADLDFGQELGEGIRRIYEEMRLAGLQDPVYIQTAMSVRLVLFGEPMDRRLDDQLTPEGRAVAVALRDAGRLSTGEITELIGRSRPYALRVLSSLEAIGIIRRVGKSPKDPRAYWEVLRR